MYMHAVYKIREFLSYEFTSVHTTVHVYVINCFNAKLFRGALPVAPAMTCKKCGPINYVTATHFAISARGRAEKQHIVSQVVAYGRLKTIENFKQSSLEVVAYERWSPTRGSIYSDLT